MLGSVLSRVFSNGGAHGTGLGINLFHISWACGFCFSIALEMVGSLGRKSRFTGMYLESDKTKTTQL